MSQFKNVLEVLSLLEKSNCRECGEKTCMAFAASVFLGNRELHHCPKLSSDITGKYRAQEKKSNVYEEDFKKMMEELTAELKNLDLAERAKTIGATYDAGRLTLKIMGKDFSIDAEGKVYTSLHVNSWIFMITHHYIIHCQGVPVAENWVPFRELPSGQDWYRLFGQQSEKPLKKMADSYPDLFADLVHIFSGKQMVDQFQSDIAVILWPLPQVPMLICYWKPEEGMDSSLNLFFDATAEDNLSIEGIYQLGTGFTQMLEKLIQQHGYDKRVMRENS